ncbi:MAG: hypothetical protein PHS96_03965 [Anaerolineales bacterium]|nr:hypothetical protein [Anaerolineales bacterium]
MTTHVKVLGLLYIFLGAIGVIAAGIVVVAVAGGGLISGDRTAIQITGLVAFILGSLVIIFSTPGIIAGIGLLNMKAWARILALVLGVLNLPNFPIGTLLGGYTLWALLDANTTKLFEEEAHAKAVQAEAGS